MKASQSQESAVRRLAVGSFWVNVGLTALKAIVGWIAHSDALLADAAHSGADVAGAIAVLVGVRVARRPADADHPYGHGKAEWIASSLVAVALVLAGLDVMVEAALALFRPLVAPPESAALVTALFALALKEVMYQYQMKRGREWHSPALVAGAADHRSDVYTSLAAAAGIAIAMASGVLHAPLLRFADPLAGLAVSGVVVRIGYNLAVQSFRSLLDEVLDPQTTAAMEEVASHVNGVTRVDVLRIRSSGSYWIVDIKISVHPEITVRAGHHIAVSVKDSIMSRFDEVYDVLVHVNPYLEDDD